MYHRSIIIVEIKLSNENIDLTGFLLVTQADDLQSPVPLQATTEPM